MKKLFLIVLTMFFTSLAGFASEKFTIKVLPNESYLILLSSSATNVMESNSALLHSEILTTLYNEKDQVLLKPKAEGIARLYIAYGDNEYTIIEVVINKASPREVVMPDCKSVKAILKIDTVNNMYENILSGFGVKTQETTKDESQNNSKSNKKKVKYLNDCFDEELPFDFDKPPVLRGTMH